MKKALSIALCVIVLIVISSLVAPMGNDGTKVSAATVTEEKIGVNESRFLNMLNHNFVYNSDFDSADTVVNNASLALLDLRDSENSDFIADIYVKDFVKDMYGIEIADMSGINATYPQLDGYLYVIPRGYTTYKHTIVSINENEDGSFTVVSEVVADDHDGEDRPLKAVSLFVENSDSAFGYNMIYCNILTDSVEI